MALLKSEIPGIFADVQVDSHGNRVIPISRLIGALIEKKHSKAAAEFAIQDCLVSSLVEETTVSEMVVLPGPNRFTVQSKKSTQVVPALRATDALWLQWRLEHSTREHTVEAQGVAAESRLDIGIIVALKEEFAVFAEFVKVPLKPVNDESSGSQYYEFEYSTSGGATYRCVATFAGQMGESSATRVTMRMIARYNPTTIAVMGIAGALDKGIRLCDIVVADSVDSYGENSKAVPTDDEKGFTFELSGKAYPPSHTLKQAIDNAEFANKSAFLKLIRECAEDLKNEVGEVDTFIKRRWIRETPQIHCGPIASGQTVGAAKQFTAFLRKHNRKYMALGDGIRGRPGGDPRAEESAEITGYSRHFRLW